MEETKTLAKAVERKTAYFHSGEQSLFYWMHQPNKQISLRAIVLLCPPLGHEYMASHRTFRHLADNLACRGLLAVRFDYANTGNSSDVNGESLGISNLVQNVVDLCHKLKYSNPKADICCIGFRMGASVAMLAAEKTEITNLVLWEPCIKGRRYAREIKALSGILQNSNYTQDTVEATGVTLTEKFEKELNNLDLTNCAPKDTKNLLYLHRGEKKPNLNFNDSLKDKVGRVKTASFEGFDSMVTYPTETIVPFSAINAQVSFLLDSVSQSKSTNQYISVVEKFKNNNELRTERFVERAVHFGIENQLFGILNRSSKHNEYHDTLVIFLNCGSEHHVGPHRIYTDFARRLANEGMNSFRIDIEGIGDSFTNGNNRDNYAYSPSAIQDVTHALRYANKEGFDKFVFTGICAGAYHSFKAAAELVEYDIKGAILVNPLVFDWCESASNSQSKNILQQGEIMRYQALLFSRHAWSKLLKGGVDLRNLANTLFSFLSFRIMKLVSHFTNPDNNIVNRNLAQYSTLNRQLNFILAENDPGYQILLADAKKTATKYLKQGRLKIEFIEGVDHGLSKGWMRERVFEILLQAIKKQFL